MKSGYEMSPKKRSMGRRGRRRRWIIPNPRAFMSAFPSRVSAVSGCLFIEPLGLVSADSSDVRYGGLDADGT